MALLIIHPTKTVAFSISNLHSVRTQVDTCNTDSFDTITSATSTRMDPPTVLAANNQNDNLKSFHSSVASLVLSMTVLANTFGVSALAVSGGGLDYANIDITGQDFSNNPKAYKGKDFTQVIAKGTNFSYSNLQGCRFYKAYLVNTNFEGSDLRGASLEDTSMDGANLKNAVVSGAYFSASLLDVATAEGADFTDAQIPVKTLTSFCEKKDIVKGTNPVTGVDTRESLMCLD